MPCLPIIENNKITGFACMEDKYMDKKINSNQKGKRGEREFVALCKEYGFDEAKRSQQYAGGVDSADVVGLPYVHIEVKLWDRITVEDVRTFLKQAIKDSYNSNNIPIVAYKQKYGKWFIAMQLKDLADMYSFVVMYDNMKTHIDKDYEEYFSRETYYVTMPADDWFMLYREFYSGMKMLEEKKENK